MVLTSFSNQFYYLINIDGQFTIYCIPNDAWQLNARETTSPVFSLAVISVMKEGPLC